MGQRGRKSAAELATTLLGVVPRPVAPDHLTDAEAVVWQDIVLSMQPEYFKRHDYDQLANLCRHVVAARAISGWLERSLTSDEASVEDVERLLRMRSKETSSANALARSLRLTKQAQVSPKGAAGKAAPDAPRPWD